MMRYFVNWYKTYRNRLTSEVGQIGYFCFRVTKRRKQIVGIEIWQPRAGGSYEYTAMIDPSVRNKDGL